MRISDWSSDVCSSDLRGQLRTRALAAYADGTYHLTDRLALTAGVRWSDEKRIYSFASPADGPPQVDDSAKSWSSVTPRAVVLYKMTDNRSEEHTLNSSH